MIARIVTIAVSVVLLAWVIFECQDTLEYHEIGLNFNRITYTVDKHGYGSGRWWIGLGHRFIKFNQTWNTIQFSEARDSTTRGKPLSSRTRDGLEVILECSFQYRLWANGFTHDEQPTTTPAPPLTTTDGEEISTTEEEGLFDVREGSVDEYTAFASVENDRNDTLTLPPGVPVDSEDNTLYEVYMKYGTDFENIFIPMAIEEISREATQHDATFFFSQRSLVQEQFFESLKRFFRERGHVQIASFQLRSVSLPSAFEEAIKETEVKNQDRQTAEAERLNRVVAAQTDVLTAEKEAAKVLIQANATYQSVILQAQAYVEQYNLSQGLQASAFDPLYDRMERDEKLLFEYMDMRAVRDQRSGNVVANIPKL